MVEKTAGMSKKHRYASNYSSPLPRKNNKTRPQRCSVIMRHKTIGSAGKYHYRFYLDVKEQQADHPQEKD